MDINDLHNYQIASSGHIIDNTHCGLFLDMGLGKTVSTLTAINKLMFEELEVNKILVIAPKRVAENVWHEECMKWEHLNHLKVSIVAGTEKQRLAALNAKADIYTIGRDNTSWLCGQYGGSMLPFDMVVIDESSSFKSPRSQRFKALRGVQTSFNRVVILTGTPAPNGLIDLWSQIYLLDRGARLGKFISNYREEYFTPGQRNGAIIYNYKIKKTGEERIHEKIKDICMSMKATDYIDMPDLINNTIEIKLPQPIQDKYDDFEKTQVLQLLEEQDDDKDISAVNAAALSNKLLQFAGGAVYDENKDYHETHDLKLDAAEEIVETANGQPVLIAWTYRHELYRLQERLKKYNPRELKTSKDIADWNNKKIQVLLTHPASGGHGLNLQSGGNIILWFGLNWSLELNQQLNARLYRQGQKNTVIIHYLVTTKTHDQDVIKSLKNKDLKQESLMKAIKAKIKKYTSS